MTPPPPFPPGWRPRASDDVDFSHGEGRWLLMDPVSKQILVLDAAQALVWSFCDGERDVSTIDSDVRQAFGAARRDPGVHATLELFLTRGFLEAP